MIKAIDRYGQGRMFTIGPFRADYNPTDNRMTIGTDDNVFAHARYVGGTRWRIQFAVGGKLRGNHVAFVTDLWDLAAQMEAQVVARAVHSGVTRGLMDRTTLDQTAEDAHTYFAVREKDTDDTKGLGWSIVRGWSETENFERYPLDRFEVRRLFFGIPMRGPLRLADIPVTTVPKAEKKPEPVRGENLTIPRIGHGSKIWRVEAEADRFVRRVQEASSVIGCIEPAEDFLGATLYGRGITAKDAKNATEWLFSEVNTRFGGRGTLFEDFVNFVNTRFSCTITTKGVIRDANENTDPSDKVITLGEFVAGAGA